MKKALILINAYADMSSSLHQCERLRQEFDKLGVVADVLKNDGFSAVIEGCDVVGRVSGYDFCVYLDKDKYVSEMLESCGLRLFNSHRAVTDCDDKMCTYIRLAGKGIKMVKTLPGLLCYTDGADIKPETVERVEGELDYPIVVKECYGSLGKGVYLARDRAELVALMRRVLKKEHLYQQGVKSSLGTDVRVIVVGNQVVAAMKRHSDTDFRSNIELGGKGEKIDLPQAFADMAVKASVALGLDYCGVDILYDTDGSPILCEVNSNAFFGGIEGVTGVNVAKAYAEYIYKEIYK